MGGDRRRPPWTRGASSTSAGTPTKAVPRIRAPRAEPPADAVPPLVQYHHPGRGCAAVIGGFVYRGARLPQARGRYFYGDTCSGAVWSIRADSRFPKPRREPIGVGQLSSFGEDARGELYLVGRGSGSIFRAHGHADDRARLDLAAAARDPRAAADPVPSPRARLRGDGRRSCRARRRQGTLGGRRRRPGARCRHGRRRSTVACSGSPPTQPRPRRMLDACSAGRTHEVVSGLCLRTADWEELGRA